MEDTVSQGPEGVGGLTGKGPGLHLQNGSQIRGSVVFVPKRNKVGLFPITCPEEVATVACSESESLRPDSEEVTWKTPDQMAGGMSGQKRNAPS